MPIPVPAMPPGYLTTMAIFSAGVTDLGEQSNPNADWMNISIGSIDIVPTGHEYVTADGKTVFVPSASTLVAMATNPAASGLSDTVGSIVWTRLDLRGCNISWQYCWNTFRE